MTYAKHCHGIVCLCLVLSGTPTLLAQVPLGHRVTDTRISVEGADHWGHWSLPSHVLDIEPDGTVHPHYFRQIYDVIAGDRGTFRNPVEPPSLRGEDRGIGNLSRTPARTREGDLALDEERIGSYLDDDFGRWPGNESQIVLNGRLHAVTRFAETGNNELSVTLRNQQTGRVTTPTFGTRDKVEVPTYDYFLQPGISRVGSNPESAGNILDGDLDTYWEPDLRADSNSWWIEVGLGRLIVVEKIVLHFVEETQGDPFRQFRVLVAPNQHLNSGLEGILKFTLLTGTEAPNTDRRSFEFSFENEPLFVETAADPAWTGRLTRTLRILVTESRLFRARQITQEEWEALPGEDRGDVVYYIRDQAGFEEPVEQSIYESLGADQQGRKEYYVRERPRLAEIEVWGWGDNLAPGIIAGGGSVELRGPDKASSGFDADWSTTFRILHWTPINPELGVVFVDLGARIWLDAMRILSRSDGYIVEGSDGTRDAAGNLRWSQISPAAREDNSATLHCCYTDSYDPPLSVRFINMRVFSLHVTWPNLDDVRDIAFFTRGYVADAPIVSDIIRLPGPRKFGSISWDPGPGQQPEGTSVEIRTRTGDLIVERVTYHGAGGNEITKEAWEKTISSYRGPVDTSFVVGGEWSPWSQKYLHPGQQVTSPGLKNFMQIQGRFTSDDREKAASIRSLEIELSQPFAQSLVGEVWPQMASPGKLDTFEVYVLSRFIDQPPSARMSGFDEVLLKAPPGVEFDLLNLDSGTEEEFRLGTPYRTFAREAGFVSASGSALEIFRDRGDSIWVRLPQQHQSLSANVVPKLYNRVAAQGGEVVVGYDGEVLTEAAYGLLPEEERGQVLFFRKPSGTGRGTALVEVSGRDAYDRLDPDEKGPIRYFRKLVGSGSGYPFDARGDSLTATSYNDLPASDKGAVIGTGRLLRMRFTSAVFLNGTTLETFVRDAGQASGPGGGWQQVSSGEATALSPSRSLSISVPLDGTVLGDLILEPNPFTPNGDGVNDELQVSVSVFRVNVVREARMRVYTLDGRVVWEEVQPALGGRHTFTWRGVDRSGQPVPPGMYLCQIHLDADSEQAGERTVSRVVAVAY